MQLRILGIILDYQVSPKSDDQHLQKKQKRRHEHGRDSYVKTEAEIGATQPRTNELPEPPNANKKRKHSSPEPLRGVQPCRHIDFTLLDSRTMRDCVSVVLSHSVCGNLLQWPYERNSYQFYTFQTWSPFYYPNIG